jgi:D-sedoheptulose 7-phosphate isomerase
MTGSEHVRRLQLALGDAGPMLDKAARWGRELATCLAGGARLLVAGNGGSAAQAQHLAAELVCKYRDPRMAYSAIALNAETSSMTAIVNDLGADELFARQVHAHGRPGDVCLLMSTSGRSANVVAAAAAARETGLRVLAMCGSGTSPLAQLAHDAMCMPAQDTATVQELHLVAMHELCEAFDVACATADQAQAAEAQAERLAAAAS